jgi:tetraacyldisaccharide 4'-kinase
MASKRQESFLVRSWYQGSYWLILLIPLAIFYGLISTLRRKLYHAGLLLTFRAAVPVVVVGNITVGGTGKTPVVIALVKALRQKGFRPGVISRGYGSQAKNYPFSVTEDGSPLLCGDEPLLIAQKTNAPVVIDANRKNAINALLQDHDCNVIVADDGLQHYALERDIEIVVVDGQRGFGNGYLLPVGPLRETTKRLTNVDFIVTNGCSDQAITVPMRVKQSTMELKATQLVSNTDGRVVALEDWSHSKQVHAVAGIGNPSRFYASLRHLGFTVIEHSFPDHHAYQLEDLLFDDSTFDEGLPIIMTEKDAVKVRQISAPDNCWYLPVEAVFTNDFFPAVIDRLQSITQSQSSRVKS